MKKVLMALACSLALAATAQAEIVTYQYTARITDINVFSPVPYSSENVASTSVPGFTLSVGDTFQGTFSYDTHTPLSSDGTIGDNGTWNDYYSPANFITAVHSGDAHTIDSRTGAGANLSIIDQQPGAGWDNFHFSGGRWLPGGGGEGAEIDFDDNTATALASNYIPAGFSAFPESSFTYKWAVAPGPGYIQVVAGGTLTSLTLVSSVPEPETYAMLMAGLGLVAWRRQRNAKSA